MAFLIILYICSYFLLSRWQQTKHFASLTVGLILLRYSNFSPTLNSTLCIRNVFGFYRKKFIIATERFSESFLLTKYNKSRLVEKNNITRFQYSPLCRIFWFEVLIREPQTGYFSDHGSIFEIEKINFTCKRITNNGYFVDHLKNISR